jgi:xanthine dehydrogenase accessory factor
MSEVSAAEVSASLLSAAEQGCTAVAVTVVGCADAHLLGRRRLQSDDEVGDLGTSELNEAASTLMSAARSDLRAQDGLRTVEVAGHGMVELYLEVRRPIKELLVVGAGHIAQPMAHIGALLGYRVIVLDDRPDFATRERFPDADRLVRADFSDPFADIALHERSHLLLVTRGHKYDYECLIRALRTDPAPAYIGMIGSRRRVRATYVQLIEEGVDRHLIDRIHAPVGLDIGAETPEEIAVAVAAELIMLDRGGTGLPLKGVERVAERFFDAPEPTNTSDDEQDAS